MSTAIAAPPADPAAQRAAAEPRVWQAPLVPIARAATVGADPRFVGALRRLVVERAAVARGEIEGGALSGVVGRLRPFPDVCPENCCPNPRAPLPAVAGED